MNAGEIDKTLPSLVEKVAEGGLNLQQADERHDRAQHTGVDEAFDYVAAANASCKC
jgi:hypothetical protein